MLATVLHTYCSGDSVQPSVSSIRIENNKKYGKKHLWGGIKMACFIYSSTACTVNPAGIRQGDSKRLNVFNGTSLTGILPNFTKSHFSLR
jgi:hypothetical protein